ncbi:MAG TPA: hypothetical protein VFG52_07285 [Xanthomonadales bacterium]|nr:hypothetical protein [Xanthomonadales bacterium]
MYSLRRRRAEVDRLATRAGNTAREMRRIHWLIGRKLHQRMQEPGSLAWAFATGTLAGAARPGATGASDAFSLLSWFNAGATACSLLLGPYQRRPFGGQSM